MKLIIVLKSHHPTIIANKQEVEGANVQILTEQNNPLIRVISDGKTVLGFHVDQLIYYRFE